ncbi:MAG: 2,3-bisphosphoglycerate-independent phosphoglycerate mutase [Acidobacteria bacterium]|nr:2,3-bisphosphoglycerate-independent phosphoglycerate mutase [Acidobacteriota bacterium]
MPKRPKPVVLTILDGWGYRAERENNAIALARKPIYNELLGKFPNTLVHTSGPHVGLPEGQMGNSEVGHLNIGAGRIIYMDITRIDLAIQSGELFQNELLLKAMERGRQKQLHLLGLVSDGGVHSQLEHLFALLEMAKKNGVNRLFVHAFMDGRDTPPEAGAGYLQQVEEKLRELGVGQIATLSGRYYAMDRDNRWPRIEKAYRALVHGEARYTQTDPVAAVRESYQREVTDEFIEPVVLKERDASTFARHGERQSNHGQPRTRIQDGDAVIFYNFRADRARQMTRALTEPGFSGFNDPQRPKDLFYVSMTRYDKTFTWVPYLFGPQTVENILANVFAREGMKNLRVAETEKYAHVTYFFNGGIEKPYEGEERVLVPSPKVPTYDLKPEMNAEGIAAEVVKAIQKGEFDALVVNFANADMVGHSGKLEAAISAVEAVDRCLGQIYASLQERGGAWIISADHGNAETMVNQDGSPHTYHTTNPVPFVLISDNTSVQLRSDGSLQDIAPTILGLMGRPQPAEMKGRDLRLVS